MTSYHKVIERIFSLKRFSKREDKLLVTSRLASALGDPQYTYPIIHIAGTNGKGSVAFKLSRALSASGYKVGLFTSPHLVTYRERIEINGVLISQEDVIHSVEQLSLLSKHLNIEPTFFELTTCLAFYYYAQKGVDVAIIESGLGGKFDPTNIVRPILTIITSIGYDHADILGYTLESIAKQKSGIIKKEIPLVLGPFARCRSIFNQARLLKAPLYQVEKIGGSFDDENQAIAAQAINVLSARFTLIPEQVKQALKTRPLCRFEEREIFFNNTSLQVIFDVAHNPPAFERLFQDLKHAYPKQPIVLLMSLSEKKHLTACLKEIQRKVSWIICLPKIHPRLVIPQNMATICLKLEMSCFSLFETGEQAISFALNMAHQKKGVLLVAGSFFIMDYVRSSLCFPDTLRQTSIGKFHNDPENCSLI